MERGMLMILKELRKRAAFESCGFGDIEIGAAFKMHFPFEMPATTDELTAGVKECTRMYRQSWILPLIDDLIALDNGEISVIEIQRKHCLE
jgi:hypothetical protein